MIETEVRKALRCTEPLAVLGPAPRGDCQAGRLLSSLACRRPPRPGEDTVSAPTVDRCPFLPLPEEGPAPRDLPTGVPAGLVPAPHGLRPEATRGHKEHVLFCSRAVMAQSPLVCRSQVCTTVTPEAQERTAPDLVHRQVVRNTSEPRAAGETVSGRCWWPSSTGSGRCVSQESKRSAARRPALLPSRRLEAPPARRLRGRTSGFPRGTAAHGKDARRRRVATAALQGRVRTSGDFGSRRTFTLSCDQNDFLNAM